MPPRFRSLCALAAIAVAIIGIGALLTAPPTQAAIVPGLLPTIDHPSVDQMGKPPAPAFWRNPSRHQEHRRHADHIPAVLLKDEHDNDTTTPDPTWQSWAHCKPLRRAATILRPCCSCRQGNC